MPKLWKSIKSFSFPFAYSEFKFFLRRIFCSTESIELDLKDEYAARIYEISDYLGFSPNDVIKWMIFTVMENEELFNEFKKERAKKTAPTQNSVGLDTGKKRRSSQGQKQIRKTSQTQKTNRGKRK